MTASTVYRRDEDGYKRLTILMEEKGETSPVNDSINVVAPNGTDLCRINIFCNEDGSWGDVDVILQKDQQGKFFAMLDGRPVINETPLGVRVYAVDIRDK